MPHLSSTDRPWGKPFKTKRYLHPPFAENMVTMWSNSMVMIGVIPPENPQHHYEHPKYGMFWCVCTEDSAALVFTLKRGSDLRFRQRENPNYQNYTWSDELMPAENTRYHTRPDGIPVHSFSKDMDALNFREEAFCENERVPITYIKVTIENNFGFEEKIELSGLVRRGKEFLFTGCNEPDGYDGYHPTREDVRVLKRLKECGVRVLLVSAAPYYEIAEYSDVLLPCYVDISGIKNSSVAPIALIDCICNATAMKLGDDALEYMRMNEAEFKKIEVLFEQ